MNTSFIYEIPEGFFYWPWSKQEQWWVKLLISNHLEGWYNYANRTFHFKGQFACKVCCPTWDKDRLEMGGNLDALNAHINSPEHINNTVLVELANENQ